MLYELTECYFSANFARPCDSSFFVFFTIIGEHINEYGQRQTMIGRICFDPLVKTEPLTWTMTKIVRKTDRNRSRGEQKGTVMTMIIDRIALIVAIVGALNWGSVGLFQFDLVSWICGGASTVAARIIYTVVALAGIWCISLVFRARESIEQLDR